MVSTPCSTSGKNALKMVSERGFSGQHSPFHIHHLILNPDKTAHTNMAAANQLFSRQLSHKLIDARYTTVTHLKSCYTLKDVQPLAVQNTKHNQSSKTCTQPFQFIVQNIHKYKPAVARNPHCIVYPINIYKFNCSDEKHSVVLRDEASVRTYLTSTGASFSSGGSDEVANVESVNLHAKNIPR
jgi:hypothetical protein